MKSVGSTDSIKRSESNSLWAVAASEEVSTTSHCFPASNAAVSDAVAGWGENEGLGCLWASE